jgi:CBS domain-containing protein
MRCAEVMKQSVVYVTLDETVRTAAQLMREANVGFLPVVDEQKRLVGTLTDRDVTVRVAAADLEAGGVPVRDVMSRELVTCRPDDDVVRARELMAENHKGRIVVAGADGFVHGVLSLTDLAELDERTAADTLREVASRERRPS